MLDDARAESVAQELVQKRMLDDACAESVAQELLQKRMLDDARAESVAQELVRACVMMLACVANELSLLLLLFLLQLSNFNCH
jgi:hypothetical protein